MRDAQKGIRISAKSEMQNPTVSCVDMECPQCKFSKSSVFEQVWKDSLWESMELAGIEEYNIASSNGQIDEDGIPFITVYLDGAWSKRSYGHNYNANSGVVST